MDEETPIVLPDDPSFGGEVQVDYPGYRSTRWRAPKRPLVTLPEEFHDLAGPVFGDEAIEEFDHDLTRQHAGEPLGERIIPVCHNRQVPSSMGVTQISCSPCSSMKRPKAIPGPT